MASIRGFVALCGLLFCAHAQSVERITDFHSDIVVNADASMDVAETIQVQAEGERIKHGILRDFPTDYRDRYNSPVQVGFDPLSVEIDGVTGSWRAERQANGVRVYFGDADSVVSPGEHTYLFRYRTTRQLGFFADHDELYWNVTGTGWNFSIDQASATVALPGDIAPGQLKLEAYTGPQGAKGREYSSSVDEASHAQFETVSRLPPHSGLTIVVSFPKGFVVQPSIVRMTPRYLMVGAGGVLLALLLSLVQWWRVGRDPPGRAIMPQYEAPEGFTPAGLRYVEKQEYDKLCFTADLVDIGVRGGMQIQADGDDYALLKIPTKAVLPKPEAALHDALFAESGNVLLNTGNRKIIVAAIEGHSELIIGDSGKDKYFVSNRGKLWVPMLIALAAIVAMNFMAGIPSMHDSRGKEIPVLLLLLPLAFILIAASFSVRLTGAIGRAWREGKARGSYAKPILFSLIGIPGLALCLMVCSLAGWFAGLPGMLIAVAADAVLIAFFYLLPAPTVAGRALLDHIAGLRMYLGVAEKADLARMQAPRMDEREFQRFLPYALALDVTKNWTNRFSDSVGAAAAAAAVASMVWYQGFDSNTGGIASLSDNLETSLGGAIASASVAPGSSSGSSSGGDSGGGGGGDSGGGGGGGGGDGW